MNVYINGIGIISRCAYGAEELAELASGQTVQIRQLPLDFPTDVPSSKLRRNSRYNKLACAAADQALKNAGIPDLMERRGLEEHRIGTILSTGYGAAEYSSVFADSVVKGNPNLCSPLLFSGSVPNSCVGQICMINRLKGFSTVLAGGDPLEYAALLIRTARADHILAGSVEEYFPPLYDAFHTLDAAKGTDLSEGAAMAVLSGQKTEKTWCKVSAFSSANLGRSPLIDRPEDSNRTEKMVLDVLRQMNAPDAVFTAANGSWFDETENRAIKSVLPDIASQRPKDSFGETLGCGYMMNVLLAAASVRSDICSRPLVTGIDMIGNYTCILLEKC